MAIIDDLNLKTKLKISDKEYDFELYTIHNGIIKEIKLDNRIYTVNTGEEKEDPLPFLKKDKQDMLKKPKRKKRRYKNWSKKDEQYVIDHYANTPTKDMAKHLGIKEGPISCKAYHLGLSKYHKKDSPEKSPADPAKTTITVKDNPVQDNLEEFLGWLDKWENNTFTRADVRRCTTLSKLKTEKMIETQLEKGIIKRVSIYEFAKIKLLNRSKLDGANRVLDG